MEYIKYNQQIIDGLFKLFKEKATGTFIVASEEGSCQIVLDQGEVISASYGQFKGLDAIQAFKALNSGHYKFSENYKLRMKAAATIDNSTEALELLGYPQYLKAMAPPPPRPAVKKVAKVIEPAPVEIVKPQPERRIVSMYRGQPVYEDVPINDNKPGVKRAEPEPTEHHQPQKPVKMYRGQVIK